MKFKFLIIFLSFSYLCKAQITDSKNKIGLTKEELAIACDEYKKMTETTSYLESEKKIRAFAEKTKELLIIERVPIDSLKNRNIALKFISKNINKTKFKSITEAEIFINEMFLISEKREKENQHLYELMSRATAEQIRQISQPFFKKVKSELGG